MDIIEEILNTSEVVGSAITEQLHRLYFDSLNSRAYTDEQKLQIKKHYFSWFAKFPSFRVTLNEVATRYGNKLASDAKISSLFVSDKPEINSKCKIQIYVDNG